MLIFKVKGIYIYSGCQVDRGISWPDPQSLATYAAKAT